MVKIVYKEGCKGLNRLDCIEGISIDLFTGKRALIYPKYSEQIMLSEDKIEQCERRSRTEIEALKLIENRFATDALAAFDSPAAEFVRRFGFNLPTLVAALEIQFQKERIDALAETIDGADLLKNFTNRVWSCSRFDRYHWWIAVGGDGFASFDDMCDKWLAVPTTIY